MLNLSRSHKRLLSLTCGLLLAGSVSFSTIPYSYADDDGGDTENTDDGGDDTEGTDDTGDDDTGTDDTGDTENTDDSTDEQQTDDTPDTDKDKDKTDKTIEGSRENSADRRNGMEREESGSVDRKTSQIVRAVQAVRGDCRGTSSGSRADCVGQGLSLVASGIPRSGGYSTMRSLVAKAANRINSVVRSNRKGGSDDGYDAVSRNGVKQAQAVLAKLERDLRSVRGGGRQVASAVSELKGLLR